MNYPSASDVLNPLIENAQNLLCELVSADVSESGASRFQYVRYLRMQYHLTKGVQSYFMRAAGHGSLARYRKLRKFLCEFANEEELHYLVAAKDLEELGEEPGTIPIDVALWHAYFREIVAERPFVRIGAAAILENASGGKMKPRLQIALSSRFLNRNNTKFIVLHQHEVLPHGDQILAALDAEALSSIHLSDLAEGAQTGLLLYYRMVQWAVDEKQLSNIVGVGACEDGQREIAAIRAFTMPDLELAPETDVS